MEETGRRKFRRYQRSRETKAPDNGQKCLIAGIMFATVNDPGAPDTLRLFRVGESHELKADGDIGNRVSAAIQVVAGLLSLEPAKDE